jgi:cyanophycin synthetase
MSSRPESEDIPNPFTEGTSGDCLVRELSKRGIAHRYLSPDEITHPRLAKRRVVAFEINRVLYYFDGLGCLRVSDPHRVEVPGPLVNNAATRRKDLLKLFLRGHGVSVPEGAAFPYHAQHKAEAFFAAFCPSLSHGVCVKPVSGWLGDRVHVGIHDLPSFRIAFAAVGERYKRVLVEETVPGIAHRFTCVAGRVIAAQFSRPANVEGDGVHTIADLVAIKNAERGLNLCYARYRLQLGRRERAFLGQAGFEVSHVPEAAKLVFLNNLSNLHRGGEFIDVTDEIHPSYIELVEDVLGLFPGLIVCGADIIIEDRSDPATDDNHHVLELNRCPGFADHHYPWRGQHRDVAGAIVDYLMTTASVSGRRGE